MYRIVVITVAGAGLFVFVPSAIFMQIEQWTYWEAAYYCAITLISVGFGDFVPGYGDGIRSCANFILILCFVFCLQCFDAVGWAAGRASGL